MINKQEELTKELYSAWICHPITRMLLDNLAKDKDFFVSSISMNATSDDVSDVKIRYAAFGVKNIDGIISMIINYEKFTKYVKKQA